MPPQHGGYHIGIETVGIDHGLTPMARLQLLSFDRTSEGREWRSLMWPGAALHRHWRHRHSVAAAQVDLRRLPRLARSPEGRSMLVRCQIRQMCWRHHQSQPLGNRAERNAARALPKAISMNAATGSTKYCEQERAGGSSHQYVSRVFRHLASGSERS